MAIKDEYRAIRRRWQEGQSYGDLYALIVTWISKYKTIIRSPSLTQLIDHLCTEDVHIIVNDFLHSELYADLRKEMI